MRTGDPVVFNGKKVGVIRTLDPSVNHMEARAAFEGDYRPSKSAKFVLERAEDGQRRISITDASPSFSKISPGEKVQVILPLDVLEDRLWISK